MSLVEVMVVIAIILTLMSIIGFGVIQVYQQSQVDTTKLTMSKINQQVQIYQLRKKKLPSSGGLSEIFDGEDPPRDSWDNEFVFVVPGPGNSPFDIISLGSDGQDGGAGNAEDIKWSEIGK